MAEAMIETAGLARRYGDKLAVAGVELSFAAGRLHALVGENGAGKTTLMHMLGGLVKPSDGYVRIKGQRLRAGDAIGANRLGVGLLQQAGSLIDSMSLLDNFALAGAGLGVIDRRKLAASVRARLAELRVDCDPGRLVAGLAMKDRQLAELARLLWSGHDILLLDEPTAMVSPADADNLFAILKELAGQGLTVIFSDHHLAEVMRWADQIHVLRDGELALSAASGLDREQLLAAMFGSVATTSAQPRRRPAAGQAASALQVDGLVCSSLPGTVFDLRVGAGEIVGLAGLAGHGQKALVDALCGFEAVRSGRVTVAGQDRDGRSRYDWGMRRIPEAPLVDACIGTLSIADNLVVHRHRRAPFARGGGMLVAGSAVRACGQRVIDAERLASDDPDWLFEQLSGGNQRKLLLARELDEPGSVLIAHNPDAGLDANAVDALAGKIEQASAAGMGVLLVAEELDFIDRLADRVYCMADDGLELLDRDNWLSQARQMLAG